MSIMVEGSGGVFTSGFPFLRAQCAKFVLYHSESYACCISFPANRTNREAEEKP